MIIDPTIDEKELTSKEAAKRIYRVILNPPYLDDEIISNFPKLTEKEMEEIKKWMNEIKGKMFQHLK